MQYLLLISLVIMFLVAYYFNGKDFFAPMVMMIISYIFSCIFSIYIMNDNNYSLGADTFVIISSNLLIGVFVGSLVLGIVQRFRIGKAYDNSTVQKNITPINSAASIFFIILNVIVILFQIRYIRQIGDYSSTFVGMMQSFRNKNAYSTDLSNKLPFWLTQVMNLTSAATFIFLFSLIKFAKKQTRGKTFLQIAFILISIVSDLLSGGRFSILILLIAGVVMYHLIRIQRLGKYKTYNFKFIFRMMIIIGVAAYFFYFVKEFVGRVSEANLIDYTAHYLGTGIINFELFLKNPIAKSDIWGKETFYSLINNLRRLGIIDIDYYYIHKEFRVLNGIHMGNVYTAFRDYYRDFGILGIYSLHVVYSVVISFIYEICKKKRSNIGVIFCSMIYYTVVLYMYGNYFFSTCVCIGFLIKIIWVYILYKTLIEKRVSFTKPFRYSSRYRA